MNVASLELCRELYEVSGWENTEKAWFEFADGVMPADNDLNPEHHKRWICRAYDLGYLLRKLPRPAWVGWNINNNRFTAQWYMDMSSGDGAVADADKPEDAAAKLAIELFKQGILTKETA